MWGLALSRALIFSVELDARWMQGYKAVFVLRHVQGASGHCCPDVSVLDWCLLWLHRPPLQPRASCTPWGSLGLQVDWEVLHSLFPAVKQLEGSCGSGAVGSCWEALGELTSSDHLRQLKREVMCLVEARRPSLSSCLRTALWRTVGF